MRITRLMVAAMVLVVLAGCGAQWRQSTLAAHDLAVKTQDDVVFDMYQIGARNAMALAAAQVQNELRSVQVGGDPDQARDNVLATLKALAQKFEDLRWLYVQHEKANGLQDLVWVYIASREKYLEQLHRDFREAYGEAKEKAGDVFDMVPAVTVTSPLLDDLIQPIPTTQPVTP